MKKLAGNTDIPKIANKGKTTFINMLYVSRESNTRLLGMAVEAIEDDFESHTKLSRSIWK